MYAVVAISVQDFATMEPVVGKIRCLNVLRWRKRNHAPTGTINMVSIYVMTVRVVGKILFLLNPRRQRRNRVTNGHINMGEVYATMVPAVGVILSQKNRPWRIRNRAPIGNINMVRVYVTTVRVAGVIQRLKSLVPLRSIRATAPNPMSIQKVNGRPLTGNYATMVRVVGPTRTRRNLLWRRN